MGQSRSGNLGAVIVGGLGVVIGLVFAVPAIATVLNPPPKPPAKCPAQPAQMAGHRYTKADDLIQADLNCADLRGAVFDGLDLSQADLAGADLRGASLRHADLTQADLSYANLAGADLSFADLTQADLTKADMRGAKVWLAGSIQAQTDGLRVGLWEPGAFQLAYLFVPAALYLLVMSVVRIARGREDRTGSRWRRPRVRRAALIALIAPGAMLVGYLIFGMLLAVWTVELLKPLLIGEGVLIVMLLVELLTPAPADERDLLFRT